MPRNKKSSTRRAEKRRGSGGLGQPPPRRRNNSDLEIDFVPFAGTSSARASHGKHDGFTLQSEALNTQRNHSWGADQKLRNTKVAFVSAGDFKPTKLGEPETALADMSLEDPLAEQNTAEVSTGSPSEQHDTPLETEDETLTHFVIDVEGGQPVDTGLASPRIPSRSPPSSDSDSSDEFIVFAGRDQSGKAIRRTTPIKRHHADPYDIKIKVVEDRIQEQKELLAKKMATHEVSTSRQAPFSASSSTTHVTEIGRPCARTSKPVQLATRAKKVTGRNNERNSRLSAAKQEEEQALIEDYIANMETDEMDRPMSYNKRELGADDSSLWQETDTSSGEPSRAIHSKWDRSEICDFDDLSTSDGFIGSVQEILSKRQRKSGLQYLVVWDGQTVDEARWVPHTSLVDPAALVLIGDFETEEKLVAEILDDDEGDSDEDSDDEDMSGGSGDEDDDLELVQRKIDRMTDEKIARLLTKQEELGMGSNELMLFDDSSNGGDGIEGFNIKPAYSKRAKNTPRGAKRPRGEYPAATALADAYDGFDVMDFDRPSLKKKPKGRRGKPVFDLSDSEFEASMQMAWDNDRLKKKERKQEREELRSQGLLGKTSGKPNLKAKYQEGMGIHAVKDEIKNFLISSNTTLSLPPMDKADRKVVHELANAFNLKSKSAGKGTHRFPVLYRTSRTSSYSENAFAAVEARLTRRYLPRMDMGSKKSGNKPQRSGRGGFGSAAVSYRDGDIVGGSAPELGIENKGRAMLEKMGWSTGTALGALNNKGILQPVSHIVKTTKAGLG